MATMAGMPFTISHAAAVLPLGKTRLPLAALMIGSLSPDFAYFLPAELSRASTHNLNGILLFCLPVSLALWLLFVRVLERPTIELLPAAWRERVPRSDPLSWRSLGFAGIAVIVGAVTHVLWDAFTHAHTFVTNAFPGMHAEAFRIYGSPVRVFFILQVLSSIFGLLALAWWARSLRHSAIRVAPATGSRGALSDRARIAAVAAVFAVSVITALANYAVNADELIEYRFFRMLIGGMTGWLLGWCAVAVVINRATRPARAAVANYWSARKS